MRANRPPPRNRLITIRRPLATPHQQQALPLSPTHPVPVTVAVAEPVALSPPEADPHPHRDRKRASPFRLRPLCASLPNPHHDPSAFALFVSPATERRRQLTYR